MVMPPEGTDRHYIVYGGVSTADYDCICDGSESFGAPERDVEKVSIPGRNGNLTFDNGRFKDVSVKYAMFFASIEAFEDFKMKVLSLRGAQRFEDSHHPNEYRYATISGAIEPSVGGYMNEYCSVEITFTMFPQRYLTSGETVITITSSGVLTNPTSFEARPLIRVTRAGTVRINDYDVVVHEFPSDVTSLYLDCEMRDAYYVKDNERLSGNSGITLTYGDFPVLEPGSNTIVLTTMPRAFITPRWWTV